MFPGTVTRVEGVERVYVKYDHAGDEEFVERVEWLEPRLQMPWHPQCLQGQLVIMLTQNVRHGDPIEGLEVRWELVCKILKALTALPGLFPHVTCGLPWRFGAMFFSYIVANVTLVIENVSTTKLEVAEFNGKMALVEDWAAERDLPKKLKKDIRCDRCGAARSRARTDPAGYGIPTPSGPTTRWSGAPRGTTRRRTRSCASCRTRCGAGRPSTSTPP